MSTWRDYIKLEGFEGDEKTLLEASLDQIWVIDEGRELIMRTRSSMSNSQTLYPIYLDVMSEPITITNQGIVNGNGNTLSGNIVVGKTLNLNFNQISHLQFMTSSGEWRNSSITETLVHELLHLTDDTIKLEKAGARITSYIDALVSPLLATEPELTPEQKHVISIRVIGKFVMQEHALGRREMFDLEPQITDLTIAIGDILESSTPLVKRLNCIIR